MWASVVSLPSDCFCADASSSSDDEEPEEGPSSSKKHKSKASAEKQEGGQVFESYFKQYFTW